MDHLRISLWLSTAGLAALLWAGCEADTRVGEDVGSDGDGGAGGADSGGDMVALTADQVMRAGIVWGSCVPDDGIAGFIEDIWLRDRDATRYDLPAAVACLATSGGGCDAVQACTGVTISNDGPCTPTCDGDVYSVCDDAWHFVIDCARFGLTCDSGEGCVDPGAAACDFETFATGCVDGQPTYCSGVVERGPRCADYGLECTTGPGGSEHMCVGTGGACDSSSFGPGSIEYEGTACEGDVLVSCVNGGVHRLDCTTFGDGFGCQQTFDDGLGRDVFFCGLGSECIGSRTVTCDGTSVVFCNMGRRETVDCTELGFTGCGGSFGCTPNAFTL